MGLDTVVGSASALPSCDEPGVEKDAQVVADGWLAEAERCGEVADAGFGLSISCGALIRPGVRWIVGRPARGTEGECVGLLTTSS